MKESSGGWKIRIYVNVENAVYYVPLQYSLYKLNTIIMAPPLLLVAELNNIRERYFKLATS